MQNFKCTIHSSNKEVGQIYFSDPDYACKVVDTLFGLDSARGASLFTPVDPVVSSMFRDLQDIPFYIAPRYEEMNCPDVITSDDIVCTLIDRRYYRIPQSLRPYTENRRRTLRTLSWVLLCNCEEIRFFTAEEDD